MGDSVWIVLLGYTGGGLLGVQLFPQIYRTWRTRSADDLSYGYLMLNVVGLLMMSVYGRFKNDHALYVPVTVSLANTLVLTCMKMYFSPKETVVNELRVHKQDVVLEKI